ncbi:MAG: hypothetical protein BGO51_22485 [Rhodospirillales bacterium 69-11]|nr:MAG: hypothetical protein BGO51_22485 [Rhodospirillales bacterium 69-11]
MPESDLPSAAPSLPDAPHTTPTSSITPEEEAVAALLFPLIPTPRAARRFVACYEELMNGDRAATGAAPAKDDARGQDHAAVMLLLAVRIGAPEVTELLFPALARTAARREDCVALLRRCTALAPRMAALGMVQSLLAPLLAQMADRLPDAAFERWVPRVSRYSFGTDRSTRLSGQAGARCGRTAFRAASAA